MKKTPALYLTLTIIICVLGYISYDYLLIARQARTWPFNSGIGKNLPNFVKNFGYGLTNPSIKTISTEYEELSLNYYQIPSSSAVGGGGGIEALTSTHLLITTSSGDIVLFDLNSSTFNTNQENLLEKYSVIRDIYLDEELSEFLVFGVLDISPECKEIHIDSYSYSYTNEFNISDRKNIWKSEAACEDPSYSGAGGRITAYKGKYYISVGHFNSKIYENFEEGMNPYSQLASSSFGKLIQIDKIPPYNSSIYASGLRAPEGLFVTTDGSELFLTEIGPKGGDELNLVLKNKNYGWPCKSSGTMYGYPITYEKEWPEDLTVFGCTGSQKFEEPLFTTGPTIALSQGFQYEGNYFDKYTNNLIIGSLAGLSIFRITYENKRIGATEQIVIGERIRDIMETPDQKIAVYTDGGALVIISKNQ